MPRSIQQRLTLQRDRQTLFPFKHMFPMEVPNVYTNCRFALISFNPFVIPEATIHAHSLGDADSRPCNCFRSDSRWCWLPILQRLALPFQGSDSSSTPDTSSKKRTTRLGAWNPSWWYPSARWRRNSEQVERVEQPLGSATDCIRGTATARCWARRCRRFYALTSRIPCCTSR